MTRRFDAKLRLGRETHGLLFMGVGVGVLVLAVVTNASAQSLEDLLDRQRFLRGLSELRLEEVLEQFVASHPPADRIEAAQYEITAQRILVNDPQRSVAQRLGDAERVLEIRAALIEHQVLFLRDQPIAPQRLYEFARMFGSIEGHPAYATVEGAGDVQILESTPENPSKIEKWHSDMTFRSTPPMATVLHGKVIPKFGGDTLFASMYAAYDALSEPMRELLDPLVAVHDFRHGFAESLAEPGGAERLADAVAANPPV